MKRGMRAAVFGLIVLHGFLLAFGSVSLAADEERVVASPHDLSDGAAPACETCHGPHAASADFLSAVIPNTVGGTLCGLKAFCYGCHDGSVTSTGLYVFSASPSVYSHKVTPVVPGQKPQGGDCDRCHDPHDNSNTKFLIVSPDAELCSSCHQTGDRCHPINIKIDRPLERTWDPGAAPPVLGTRLWNTTGTEVIATGPGFIKCETCHAPHGAATPDLNTLTNVDGALCTNCHSSG